MVLVVSALVVAGCGSEEAAPPANSGGSPTSAESLPGLVAERQAAILAAAESGDYESLRAEVEPDVFLSDFGFGEEPDPVGRWEAMGPETLETMGVLLRMPPVVRETNEGTLYQWPSYDADSHAGDLSAADRELFLTVMGEEEVANLIRPELGYTAPRLGILADGTWWFFILEGEA
ncbi:MAG: hypothetical protein ABI649_07900 [Gaiellaceae bacterium]